MSQARKQRYLLFAVLLGMFTSLAFLPASDAQTRKNEVVLKTSCEQIEPLAVGLLEKEGFVLHKMNGCIHCLAGDAENLRNPGGKSISATTAYRRYIDHKVPPHSNPVVWYTERELHASAKMKLERSEEGCTVTIGFHYTFYGIQMITVLPTDGDWIQGESNLRLEAEYLSRLTDLSSGAARL